MFPNFYKTSEAIHLTSFPFLYVMFHMKATTTKSSHDCPKHNTSLADELVIS